MERARANLMFHVYNPFEDQWRESVERILGEAGFRASGAHYFKDRTQIIVPERRGREDLAKVYHMADFGIWASKAEGWNLPLIECLASGLPCITTNNTAQADFIRKGIYPDELILASHQTEPICHGVEWWKIDEEELTEKIRAIIRDPVRFLNLEGKCLESMQSFTWENAAKRLGVVLREIGVRV
jgi:glycosyltransferase involved in cell wall biosynthesis